VVGADEEESERVREGEREREREREREMLLASKALPTDDDPRGERHVIGHTAVEGSKKRTSPS